MSVTSSPPKVSLRRPFCLLRCPLGYCLFLLWFTLLSLHFFTWSSWADETTTTAQKQQWFCHSALLKPYLFLKEHLNKLFAPPSPFPPLVSVYQKCDTLRLPNGRRLMKYLCVDMTGQCVVHVEGHLRSKQALTVLEGWIFFWAILWCWLQHLKGSWRSDTGWCKEEDSKHTVGICMSPPSPSPPPSSLSPLCIVSSLRLTSWCLIMWPW